MATAAAAHSHTHFAHPRPRRGYPRRSDRELVLRGGLLVTMDAERRVLRGDLQIRAGRIAAVGGTVTAAAAPEVEVIDVAGKLVLPGLVQTHVHLTQTLFRHLACDLDLLAWLRQRIWPLEAAHDQESNYAAARLGAAELLLGGTTTVLSMETVHHTGATFRAVEEVGLRAWVGKAMMDTGDGVPAGLREDTDRSLAESVELLERWDGAAGGRLRYAFAPRFVLSCTAGLLRQVGELARRHDVPVHTHAAESPGELALVRRHYGRGNIAALHELGLLEGRAVLAHCVHPDGEEIALLARVGVAHCPSSNLKLGSGIAPIRRYLDAGIAVGLGADGAPCNDRLDVFGEMRLAALVSAGRWGVGSLPASQVLELATIGGARVLGAADRLGSLEVGKLADVVVLDPARLLGAPPPRALETAGDLGSEAAELYAWLVYVATPAHVDRVLVEGRTLVAAGRLVSGEEDVIARDATAAVAAVRRRAGV